MPAEQALPGKGLRVELGCIQHHLDDAVDSAVGVAQPGGVDAKTTGDRGAYLSCIERLALDRVAGDNVLGQRTEQGLLAKVEAKGLHAPQKPALPVPDGGEPVDQPLLLPSKMGPVGLLVDVYPPQHMRIL